MGRAAAVFLAALLGPVLFVAVYLGVAVALAVGWFVAVDRFIG